MTGYSRFKLLACAAIVLFGAAFFRSENLMAAEPLKVNLRFRADFQGQTVRVGDVADITGGTAAERRRLANLDLEDLTQRTQLLEFTRRRVHLRCLLSGVSRAKLSVAGPSKCLVRATYVTVPAMREEPRKLKQVDPDEIALQEIRETLAKRWQVPVSEVQAELTQPIPGLLKFASGPDPVSIRAYLPAATRPGTVRAKLIARLASGRVLTSTAEVAAAIASRNKQGVRGAGYSPDRRPQNHTAPTTPKQLGPIVVRPRDTVRLVARKGNLRVALAQAEVIKSARIGDMVELRNPKSRKKLSARLVSASQAVIELSNEPQTP